MENEMKKHLIEKLDIFKSAVENDDIEKLVKFVVGEHCFNKSGMTMANDFVRELITSAIVSYMSEHSIQSLKISRIEDGNEYIDTLSIEDTNLFRNGYKAEFHIMEKLYNAYKKIINNDYYGTERN